MQGCHCFKSKQAEKTDVLLKNTSSADPDLKVKTREAI